MADNLLLKKVRQQGAVIDGAMGTMLMQAGLASGTAPETWVLEKPEQILNVHHKYKDAGADILITNTFGGNSVKLKKSGLASHMGKINKHAAQLARSAAKGRCFVAGNMGPTGELLQPLGSLSKEAAQDSFCAQAQALAEGGVDLFLIQTFFSLEEILIAVKAVQSVSTLPVFASLTFQETPKGFVTLLGETVETGMKTLVDAGAAVVGTNCSLGSASMIQLAQMVRNLVSIPVLAEPNAGTPELLKGRTVYNEDAQIFSENMARIKAMGIEVIGGCCGTTPDHIRKTVLKIKEA